MATLGLFVSNGKQRLCHLLCNLLRHSVLRCPLANIILVTPHSGEQHKQAIMDCKIVSVILVDNAVKSVGDFTGYA